MLNLVLLAKITNHPLPLLQLVDRINISEDVLLVEIRTTVSSYLRVSAERAYTRNEFQEQIRSRSPAPNQSTSFKSIIHRNLLYQWVYSILWQQRETPIHKGLYHTNLHLMLFIVEVATTVYKYSSTVAAKNISDTSRYS